jgi:hypothetical protein
MELIQNYWYNFAATGDPNGEGLPEWKAYAGKFDIINLNNHSGMMPKEQQEKYDYYYNKLQTKLLRDLCGDLYIDTLVSAVIRGHLIRRE